MAQNKNPFAFKAYDEKMKSENAPNYITPDKRKKIKEYLSKSSVSYNHGTSGSIRFLITDNH
jgi:hypothetical protein